MFEFSDVLVGKVFCKYWFKLLLFINLNIILYGFFFVDIVSNWMMFGCVKMDIRVIFLKNLFFCFLEGLFFSVFIVMEIIFLGFLLMRLVVWFEK